MSWHTPLWWGRPGVVPTLLTPVSMAYRAASVLRRRFIQPVHVPIPVLCIGNLVAGGAGKTPVALAVGTFFRQQHIRAFYLTRGYGGHLPGPLLVNPDVHSARDVGDEPLLLSRILPTMVAKNRALGAHAALQHNAQMLIMDDGFQNPSLYKDFSLLVIDGTRRFGNGLPFPAGPLREPVPAGLQRADAVLVLDPVDDHVWLPATCPIFTATRNYTLSRPLADKRVVGVCGIAVPQRFHDTLLALGLDIAAFHAFPDHDPSIPWEALQAEAARLNATLITTEKDAMRLSPPLRKDMATVRMAIHLKEEEALQRLLMITLFSRQAR